MSKINLTEKDWCDIVFAGRNKAYGAYRLRANLGKRQLKAMIILMVSLAAIIAAIAVKSAVAKALEKNVDINSETTTEFAELKKEKPKPKEPEKKIDRPEPVKEVVKVKASIAFTVPKVVDDDKVDEKKVLKTQKEVTKNSFAIASQDVVGDAKGGGINIDDLKDNQEAGTENIAKKTEEKVVDNAIVDVPATYPGGEAAILRFIGQNLKYPEVALDQGLQGKVVLRFKVGKDGAVSDVQVRKSLSRECDRAAVACVRKLNRFIPAKSNGHAVPVWFTLPVTFRIE